MARQPTAFISHKHSDVRIATELRKFLERWSQKRIPVYQSSDPLAQGPRLGKPLTAELKKALWETSVVFLVFTTEDQDWSYCMWECGVATKPDTAETRVIVLQCAQDAPRVFADQVRVDVRERTDVLRLVKEFLTDPSFFPGTGGSVAPNFSRDGPEVQEAADDLYAKLAEVIPKGEGAGWAVQPFVRLELTASAIDRVATAAATQAEFEEAAVVREADPRAWHVFGMARIDPGTPMRTLIQAWSGAKPGASRVWAEDVRAQIVRAVQRELPSPSCALIEEADGPARFMPILSRVRQVPAQEVVHLDVNLVPIDASKVLSGLGDPYQADYRNAVVRVQRSAPSLVPHLAPVAMRFLGEWAGFVEGLREGVKMRGPERLEISRRLAAATRRFMLVERVLGKPYELHSRDWLALYEELGSRGDLEKIWLVCMGEPETRANAPKLEAAWRFFSARSYKALHCTPRDVERAIGAKLPPWDVFEDYGDHLKRLRLNEGAYTGGDEPNVLLTSFKVAETEDRQLLRSMVECSRPMTEEWIRSLRERKPVKREG